MAAVTIADRLSSLVVDTAERHPGAVMGAVATVSGGVLAITDGISPSTAAAVGVITAISGLVTVCVKVLLADIRHLRARVSELEHAERERAAAMDAERAELIQRIRQLEDMLRGDGR